MILTPRCIILLAGGLAGIFLGPYFPRLYPAVLVYDLLLLVLALADYLFHTSPRYLKAARSCHSVFSLEDEQEVAITLQNLRPWPVRLTIKDSPPLSFRATGKLQRLSLLPHSVKQVFYRITPYRRGRFEFGPLFLRLEGRWGLARRQVSLPLPRTVDVFPGHKNVDLFQLALHTANPQNYGLKSLRTIGEGTEFRGLREYVTGDDYRCIDWKASARRARLIVREFQAERNQQVILLLDCGRLMSPKIDNLTKLDYAANAALLVSYAALTRGDRVGLITFSSQVGSYLPPGRGSTQLARVNQTLKSAEGNFFESDYHLAFSFLARKIRRRALIIVFTEVIDQEASHTLLSHLMSFLPRHLPLCVTITDSRILEEKNRLSEKIDDVFRRTAATEYMRMYDALFRRMEDRGALVVNVPADRLSLAVVNKYLEVKRRAML